MTLQYFIVWREPGTAWRPGLPLQEQPHWSEHASFMNGLAAEGFVKLGGPLSDGEEVLLIIRAESEGDVRQRLAADPWTTAEVMTMTRISHWHVMLGGES